MLYFSRIFNIVLNLLILSGHVHNKFKYEKSERSMKDAGIFLGRKKNQRNFCVLRKKDKGILLCILKKVVIFWVDKFWSCDLFGYKIWTSSNHVIKICEWGPWVYQSTKKIWRV